jgi:hypothetical protein
MASDNQLPPPLPQEQQARDYTTKAKELLGSLASRCKAAGLLIAKQIKRTKLLKVTLPGHYRALGQRLHGEGQYRDEFPSSFQAIDALLSQIKAVEARSANEPKAEGIAAKVKAATKATWDMVRVKALKMKRGHPFAELGKAAFEKHGEQSGSTELVNPIVNAHTRLAALDSDIRHLSESPPGQVLTPRRIAIGVVGLAIVLVVLVGLLTNASQKDAKLSTNERNAAKAVASQEQPPPKQTAQEQPPPKQAAQVKADPADVQFQKSVLEFVTEAETACRLATASPTYPSYRKRLQAAEEAFARIQLPYSSTGTAIYNEAKSVLGPLKLIDGCIQHSSQLALDFCKLRLTRVEQPHGHGSFRFR